MYTFNVLDPISQAFAGICAKVDLKKLGLKKKRIINEIK